MIAAAVASCPFRITYPTRLLDDPKLVGVHQQGLCEREVSYVLGVIRGGTWGTLCWMGEQFPLWELPPTTEPTIYLVGGPFHPFHVVVVDGKLVMDPATGMVGPLGLWTTPDYWVYGVMVQLEEI